jgi:hypothetical protein
MTKPWWKPVQLTVAALLALGPLTASAGEVATYAGTVSSIDRARGAFVLQDVGPWLGKSDANIVNRTIVLTPSTALAVANRTWDSTSKFPGDYEESAAQLSDLKEGAFVAVECQPTGAACRALKLTVVQPS